VERAAANFCATCGDAVLSPSIEAKSARERFQLTAAAAHQNPNEFREKFILPKIAIL
jgi:hypothetical protein